MSANAKREPQSMMVRLALMVVGALLMVGTPFAFEILNLTARFQNTMIFGIELVFLVVGFILLYLAFRGQQPAS